MNLGRFLRKVDEATNSAGLRFWLNRHLGKAGKVARLDLDRARRRVEMVLELAGESDSLELRLDGYQLIRSGDELLVKFGRAEASRVWLDALSEKFVSGRTVKIPPDLSGLIEAYLDADEPVE